jgi:hypothetical protein
MYSEKVAQKRIEVVEKHLKIKLKHFPVGKVDELRAHLEALLNDKGELTRGLSQEEVEFIRNERLMCKCSFRYWADRYAVMQKDGTVGGGVGRVRFWSSQELALKKMGEVEDVQWDMFRKGEAVDGICVVMHKARQLGATALSRIILCHRETSYKHIRGMAASVDDDKIMELYDRDKLCINSLPFYLRPEIGYDVKGEHIYFDKLDSRMLYQQSRQQSGLGQGRQFDIAHLTECAFWPYPNMIELDFFPTLPLGINTLCILESTANGLGGWWYDFTEDVRKGLQRRWKYIFAPWYIETRKNRATPPADWTPSDLTMKHARRVYETSRLYTGRDVLLEKEQLYWYETERDAARRRGKLNLFLTNFCATPEESFQHTGASQFSVDVLERIRLGVVVPNFYEVQVNNGT